tara:strand:- start:1006 stop:1260 length:255 start_codon:yes stop_codon:yes gene_type:complete
MEQSTKEIILRNIEKTIEEKNIIIRAILLHQKEITKIKKQHGNFTIAIEECEFLIELDNLKIKNLDKIIDALKNMIVKNKIRNK